jgi:tRNA(adenine34) deaminase
MTELDLSAEEKQALSAAINRAMKAKDESGKAGIAASIVRNGVEVGTGENEVRLQSDPTKHAEMVALAAAAQTLGTTDLSDCVMISTLQPCEMCLSAMRFAGIRRVVFAATQANVAEKYFMFPRLSIEDFRQAGDAFEVVGGQMEDRVIDLYKNGDE